MKKFLKWGFVAVIAFIAISVGAFYVWSQATYGPSDELVARVNIDSLLVDEDVVIRAKGEVKAGIILYPGAKVENAAYSYYGALLAEAGYDVFIPSVLLNFSLLSVNNSSIIMESNTNITNWYVGGHSLGGVAATMFAKEHMTAIDGVILLASYPSEGSNLSDTNLAVLSLYAEFDGLTEQSDIENSRALLPVNTDFVEIKGGNHAQFGMYGKQKGDLQAEISAVEQQEQLAQETILWLNTLK